MTSQPPIPPVVPVNDDQVDIEHDEHVDSDGTPVGEADRDEDIRRAGGDPDDAE